GRRQGEKGQEGDECEDESFPHHNLPRLTLEAPRTKRRRPRRPSAWVAGVERLSGAQLPRASLSPSVRADRSEPAPALIVFSPWRGVDCAAFSTTKEV